MKVVKKITSLLLAVLFSFGSFIVLCFATEAETGTVIESETVSSESFFSSLSDMLIEYDVNSMGSSSAEDFETKRLIVKTNTNESITDTHGAVAIIEGWNNTHILQYSTVEAANTALEFYETQDYVQYAEEDEYYTYSSDDEIIETMEYTSTEGNLSWGTSAANFDTLNNSIIESGKVSEDREVVVAVFDSGLTTDHVLFENQDRFLPGYNVFEENKDTSDTSGHGSHVAGIIYENTLPNVKIRPYRVNLNHGKDSYSTAMSVLGTAIYLAIELGDDLINVSMKWGAYGNQYLTDAIEFAYDNNVPLIAAAGNYSSYVSTTYPANLDKVIAVSAVDDDFIPADFTNYGSAVDLAAPGVGIWSASNDKDYIVKMNGTSMAAPFVSAAVATLKLLYPDISSLTATDILKSTVTVPKKPDYTIDWELDYGTGVLNCESFMSIGKTDAPKFSFDSSEKLIMTKFSPNATIYYTTDGSTPVVGKSTVYTSPINVRGASKVKAVAYEPGKFQSDVVQYDFKRYVYLDMYYEETASFDELMIPPNAKVTSCYSSDEEVVTVDKSERCIYATGRGEATVTIFLNNNRRVIVNVTVEYNFFQWIFLIIRWAFFWFIP